MKAKVDPREIFTINQVADYLKAKCSTIYRLAANRKHGLSRWVLPRGFLTLILRDEFNNSHPTWVLSHA